MSKLAAVRMRLAAWTVVQWVAVVLIVIVAACKVVRDVGGAVRTRRS